MILEKFRHQHSDPRPARASNPHLGRASAILAEPARAARRWRVKELALHFTANACDYAGADHLAALQLTRHRAQERITQIGIERPGRGKDGVQLGIGTTKWRHGGGSRLANRASD